MFNNIIIGFILSFFLFYVGVISAQGLTITHKCHQWSNPDAKYCPPSSVIKERYIDGNKELCGRICEYDKAGCCVFQDIRKHNNFKKGVDNYCVSYSGDLIDSPMPGATAKISYATACREVFSE